MEREGEEDEWVEEERGGERERAGRVRERETVGVQQTGKERKRGKTDLK